MQGGSRTTATRGHRAVSAVLFLALFAGQSALIALSPVLVAVAADLGISTAVAGQLRTITGLTAAATALALGAVTERVGLGRLLLAATGLLALGSLASAAAPSFALLAAAQVPIGVGVAGVTTAGTLAAAEWVPDEHRTRALSWALIGQPAAWIVGMPLIGAVGEHSWRYGWLALPFAAAAAAGVAVSRRARARPARPRQGRTRDVLREPRLARWLASELLANAAWAGTIVYAGALFVESHGTSSGLTGVLLAVAAAAYVVGNLAARRLAGKEPLRLLVAFAVALALADTLFGAVRPDPVTSTALFAIAGAAAGGRTLVASAYGLAAGPELRASATSLRAATMQLGYFLGSTAGGAALAAGGYGAFGAVMGLLFLAAGAVLALRPAAVSAESAVVGSGSGTWTSGSSAPWRFSTATRRWRSPLASSGPC